MANGLQRREAEEAEITLLRPQSVKAPAKGFVAPMLATPVTEPPKGGAWVYEVKYDGYRMLAQIAAGRVRLFTRTGNDWTAKLPHLANELAGLGLHDSLLDGEIVVPGEGGRSDFQALQSAFDAGSDRRIVYYVFDAPCLNGQDLRGLSLLDRKKRLGKALKPHNHVKLSEHLSGEAKEVLQKACELGLEGLIGKEAHSVYASGRSKSWIKLKCRQRQDFVIGGYTPPRGSRPGFGALLVGFYDPCGKLRYAGKVGTGFDDALLAGLSRKMAGLKTKASAFENPPRDKGVTWLRPKLVGEVAYAQKTKEGFLRQASFVGLREDLSAKLSFKITNPGRPIWPLLGIRKIDLLRYYAQIGEWILPHVKERPLTLVRCPDGVGKECFYQRHLQMGARPGTLRTVKRARKERGAYLYASTIEGVLSAVQNGAVEFHTWGATVPDLQHPDRITIDLDPGPGISWARLAEATRLVKVLLDQLGLASFLKTTGGKGLHVVAPLVPKLPWDEVKEFTRLIALMLTRARPDLFLAKMSKAAREGKIFVDYLRNSETASAVAAYSARARPDAGVSTPLAWDELGEEDVRTRYTLGTVPQRLKKLRLDPWAEYWTRRQSITPRMRKALMP